MSAQPGKRRARILITAGPTREKIDPIRFISNYSTGTFGYELARQASRRGNAVTLISGPTMLEKPKGVKVLCVESGREMHDAVMKELPKNDCVIMAAAVSDWRPRIEAKKKIKRGSGSKTLELIENTDILAEVGRKKRGTITVGFALETDHVEKNALKKLRQKNADMMIANKLTSRSCVFGDNATDIIIIDRRGSRMRLRHRSKRELAKNILDKVSSFDIYSKN